MMSPWRRWWTGCAGVQPRARSHACTRDYERRRLHRNGEQLRASCGALSPESEARSSRTVPTRLGYLPPGVSTSSAQQQEAGAVVGAPSHRQHRARLSSLPFPRSVHVRREHPSTIARESSREIAEHEVRDPSRRPSRRPVNQRSNPSGPSPPSTPCHQRKSSDRRIQSFTLANAAGNTSAVVASPDP